eukprot:gene23786-9954_t
MRYGTWRNPNRKTERTVNGSTEEDFVNKAKKVFESGEEDKAELSARPRRQLIGATGDAHIMGAPRPIRKPK